MKLTHINYDGNGSVEITTYSSPELKTVTAGGVKGWAGKIQEIKDSATHEMEREFVSGLTDTWILDNLQDNGDTTPIFHSDKLQNILPGLFLWYGGDEHILYVTGQAA